MNDYLQSVPKGTYRADSDTPGVFSSIIKTGEYENREVFLIANNTDPTPEIGGKVIGAWTLDGDMVRDDNGNIVHPLDPDYYKIRPIGNESDGKSTGGLQYTHWMGWNPRQLDPDSETNPYYPTDNQPFGLRMQHKWFEGTWAGWGWRAEVDPDWLDTTRDISVRAIGIYSDENARNYLYTTGAFQQGESENGFTDEDGNPQQVWFTETPAGRATTQKEPTHFALLWAAKQEGHFTLTPEVERVDRLYWKENQPQSQGQGRRRGRGRQ